MISNRVIRIGLGSASLSSLSRMHGAGSPTVQLDSSLRASYEGAALDGESVGLEAVSRVEDYPEDGSGEG